MLYIYMYLRLYGKKQYGGQGFTIFSEFGKCPANRLKQSTGNIRPPIDWVHGKMSCSCWF